MAFSPVEPSEAAALSTSYLPSPRMRPLQHFRLVQTIQYNLIQLELDEMPLPSVRPSLGRMPISCRRRARP